MAFEGLLNAKCTIQQATRVQNPVTRQVVDTWVNKYVDVKCRIDGAESAEYLGLNKLVENATNIIFLPIQYKLNAEKNRIIIDGKTYDVLQVTDAGGHGHHNEIYVQYSK